MDWVAIIGALIGLGVGIWNGISNRQGQEAANQRNEELQREAWEREDTAVQRRMKDLEAAGLSPTLAAGNAAASSGPSIKINPVESALQGLGNPVSIYQKMKQQNQALKQGDANIGLTNAQTANAKEQQQATIASTNLTNETAKEKAFQNKINENMEYYTKQTMLYDYYSSMGEARKIWDQVRMNDRTYWDRVKSYELVNKKMEDAIQHNRWEEALGLSQLLVNAFGTGAAAANAAQRNQIWAQKK